MKESIREAIDRFIYKLKEVSKLFKVKIEEGDEVSLIVEAKDSMEYKIVCMGNMFNLDYKRSIPIKQEGAYFKWTPSVLEIMRVLSDINNALIGSIANKCEILQYIISKENSLEVVDLSKEYYSCSN